MSREEETPQERLLEELCRNIPNVLTVRQLCKENKDIIGSLGIRMKIWSVLLLGAVEPISTEVTLSTIDTTTRCKEHNVLEADVPRTRSDIELFRSTSWRNALSNVLLHFCLSHDIEYKQGMNEVAAPFLSLASPPSGVAWSYLLFEAFTFRYVERFLCNDDSSYLFKAFRLFDLLLLYVDPQLAVYLQNAHFPPELYAPQWFLTVYSRALALPLVLRIWDAIIAMDDPAFLFFIGLQLIRAKRDRLLSVDVSAIPEIICNLKIEDEAVAEIIISDAMNDYKLVPKSFLRLLRLSCVNTPELTPSPHKRHYEVDRGVMSILPAISTPHSKIWKSQDIAMAKQSVRRCVAISAAELVARIKNKSHERNLVVIDVRDQNLIDDSKGGIIPTAYHVPAEFFRRREDVEIWLQHFDSMKGCIICIVDMPIVTSASTYSLWKRLLLGEGDGVSPDVVHYNNYSTNAPSKRRCNSDDKWMQRDVKSKYYTEENQTIKQDEARPALHLACTLQQAGFPYVSILDGGYPELISYLVSSGDTFEPLVINCDYEAYVAFMKVYGLPVTEKEKTVERIPEPEQKGKESEQSILSIALNVAVRLKHKNMESVLRDKILRCDS